MAHRRRSREEWKELVREVEAGDSIDQVARRHSVRAGTLKWWRWQLRRGTVARSATKAVQMVPVRVRQAPPVTPVTPVDDVVEVLVRGAMVRVRIGQDPRYIAELAAALGDRC
jgi:transposase-like protein